MDNIMVSVVIPAYNLENYIDSCLYSVRNQTLQNIEIIVIDDGSLDSTSEKIRRHMVEDKRIVYLRQNNMGVSSARNKGIQLAKGKYITFVDGDDSIAEVMLENMFYEAENHNLEIITCLFSTSKSTSFPFFKTDIISSIDYLKMMLEGHVQRTACGILFNLNFIKKNCLLFDEELSYGEDMLFTIRALLSTKSIGISSNQFYIVEQRLGSATRTKDINQYIKIERLAQKLDSIFENAKIEGFNKIVLEKYYFNNILYSLSCITRSNATLHEKVNKINELKRSKHTKNTLKLNFPAQTIEKFKANYVKYAPSVFICLTYLFWDNFKKILARKN